MPIDNIRIGTLRNSKPNVVIAPDGDLLVGVFGTEHLSDLMWALEILGWSPDLMPRPR